MDRLGEAWRRLLNFFRKGQLDHDLSEEMQFHLTMRARRNRQDGMKADAADCAARRKFGNTTLMREQSAEAWGWRWLEDLAKDVRFALRTLRKNRAFTAVAVLTLALGIGANTAIFNVIETVALRELPVPHPAQLVMLHWTGKRPANWHAQSEYGGCDARKPGVAGDGCVFPYPVFDQFRVRARSFAGMFALAPGPQVFVSTGKGEELAQAESVSGEFFSTIGVHALHGRTLEPRDDLPGAPSVAVLSHAFWRRHYGEESGIVGKAISLDGTAFTVAGIAPEDFRGLQPGSVPDLWIPLHSSNPGRWSSMKSDAASLYVFGRLRPGVRPEQARAALEVIFRQAVTPDSRQSSGQQPPAGIALTSAARGLHALRLRFLPALEVLALAAGLILLIACVNIASLLVARTAARHKELAARLAVGAGRWRLARQFFTESSVLAALGCIVGLPVAWLGSHLLATFMSSSTRIPTFVDVQLTWSLFAFAAAVSGVAALLFGLVPGWAVVRVEPAAALKTSAGVAGGSVSLTKHRSRIGRTLVGAETALAVVLLVGAGLFLRTLVNLKTLDPGFRRDHLLAVETRPKPGAAKAGSLNSLYSELQSRLGTLPGVVSVTWSGSLLLVGESASQDNVLTLRFGPRFFESMGIPILAGRTPQPEDFRLSGKVAWVNQALARRYFPKGDAIGQRLQRGYLEIAGVVGDFKYQSLRSEIEPTLFVPSPNGPNLVLRTAVDPMSLADVVRRTISETAPSLRIAHVSSLSEQIDQQLFNERMLARLSSIYALLALALAAIGTYGVVAYSVARRTSEIAIRVSLGAVPSDVVRLVLTEGMLPVAAGAAAGLFASYGLTRFVTAFLYGVTPLDALTYGVATAVLVGIAALACYFPMRQALRMQPMAALRCE